MSKAFDKVWHEGLIFKLKSRGISPASLDLTGSFLENRFQRVLPVKADVPQGPEISS